MKPHNTYVEKYRQKKLERLLYGCNGNNDNGYFLIPNADGVELGVIVSSGGGWDHVSVTRGDGENWEPQVKD